MWSISRGSTQIIYVTKMNFWWITKNISNDIFLLLIFGVDNFEFSKIHHFFHIFHFAFFFLRDYWFVYFLSAIEDYCNSCHFGDRGVTKCGVTRTSDGTGMKPWVVRELSRRFPEPVARTTGWWCCSLLVLLTIPTTNLPLFWFLSNFSFTCLSLLLCRFHP